MKTNEVTNNTLDTGFDVSSSKQMVAMVFSVMVKQVGL